MTKTQEKREARPEWALRKQLRTKVYRALYGGQGQLRGQRGNVPWLDETRDGTECAYPTAQYMWDNWAEQCEFTSQEEALHLKRLGQLRGAKRKEDNANA